MGRVGLRTGLSWHGKVGYAMTRFGRLNCCRFGSESMGSVCISVVGYGSGLERVRHGNLVRDKEWLV